MAAGNGTFTATSVNGDIIDSGLAGVVAGGTRTANGSGVVTLAAANGNIVIDDPTSAFPTNGGVVFNGKNVTLSLLGATGATLALGNSTSTSRANGNLTVTVAIGDIGNLGNIIAAGDAWFQAGSGNITLGQAANSFGSVKFVGNQVNVAQTGDMKLVVGSQAIGPAQLTTSNGNISIVSPAGSAGIVSFGNTATLSASGNITLPRLIQVANTLTVRASGTADLSALSTSNDLSGRAPVNLGTGTYVPPALP